MPGERYLWDGEPGENKSIHLAAHRFSDTAWAWKTKCGTAVPMTQCTEAVSLLPDLPKCRTCFGGLANG